MGSRVIKKFPAPKKPIFSRLLMVLGWMGLAAPAWGQGASSALDEAEAVQRAQSYGPWLRVQSADQAEVQAQVRQEEAWPAPSVNFVHEEIFPDQQTREETLILSQPFDLSARRGLRQEAARQRAQAQGLEQAVQRAERGGEARARFYRLMAAQQRLDAATRWEARVGEVAQVLERREAAGLSSKYERERVGRERERAQGLVRAEGREVLEAWRELGALWGGATDPAPLAQGALLPPEPAPLEALEQRLERGPQRQASRSLAQGARQEREAAQVWVPPMSVGLGWRRLDSQGSAGQGFAVELGFELPWGSERAARRDQAQAAEEGASARLESVELEGGAELRRLREALVGLRAQAQERREALGRGQEFLVLAHEGYGRGQLDLLEVLEAGRLCVEDEQALVELELEARLRAVALDVWSFQEEEP